MVQMQLLGAQYRAQLLYYIVFHKRNDITPLPDVIEELAPWHSHHIEMPQ